MRFIRQRAVQTDDMGLFQKILKRNATRPRGRSPPLGDQHVHAEGFAHTGDGAAELAIPDDAERKPFQFPDREIEQAEIPGTLPAARCNGQAVIVQSSDENKYLRENMLDD